MKWFGLAVSVFAAIAALSAYAQQGGARKAAELPAVGILAMGPQSVFRELPTYARFYARMRELGWREGENIRYVGCGAAGERAKLDVCMQEFLRSGAVLIVTVGYQEALAARRATATIPIVTVHPGDPVELGLASSLNRPGGNVTGNLSMPLSLYAKRVEILAEIIPGARRMLVASDPPLPAPTGKVAAIMDEAAKRHRLKLEVAELPAGGEYDVWVAKAKRDGTEAALISHAASAFRPARRKALADALIKQRLPAICGTGEYVESGCLASYNPSNTEFFASAAVYADKILRGAKPADLPIQQPTVYELAINMKTARSLGITIPQSILLRADRVIE